MLILPDARPVGTRIHITVYAGEWWHFDGPGAAVKRPHLDAPLD